MNEFFQFYYQSCIIFTVIFYIIFQINGVQKNYSQYVYPEIKAYFIECDDQTIEAFLPQFIMEKLKTYLVEIKYSKDYSIFEEIFQSTDLFYRVEDLLEDFERKIKLLRETLENEFLDVESNIQELRTDEI